MKTIGIVSLAGNVDKEKVIQAKTNLEKLGFNLKLSNNIYNQNRYLAGSEDEKWTDLKELILDKEVDIIMASRGGYGSIRLFDYIDFNLMKDNPKIYCGYSDITAFLLMVYKKTGIQTLHGPMLTSDFYQINDFTVDNFIKCIENYDLTFLGDKIYKEGKAKGVIWGGNLSTIVSLCGLDFIPDKDFIFFVEDLNEPVYKIDKMFQQLLNIQKFKQNCKGVVLGDFLHTDNEIWLEDLFFELANKLSIPFIGGFKITHGEEKITIPIGKLASLDANKLVIFSGV